MRMDWIRNSTGPGTENTYPNGETSLSSSTVSLRHAKQRSRLIIS
jgi:hypothetical protein